MPRQAAFVAENNFIRGLITETTATKFPADACTETFNCVFDETGRVTRRLGFDVEENFVLEVVSPASTDVFTEFQWQAAGGDGSINFLVQQQGSSLHFYDLSDSLDVSANKATFTIDLDTYLVDGSSRDPATEQCQYTINTGNLLVVNPACDPFYVVYDRDSNDITTTAITLKERDFQGVDDGMTLTERPVMSVATLSTDEPEHYYNLLNQGWYHGSSSTVGGDTGVTLASWDSARTDMPSNADTVGMYRASATDSFDLAMVQANSPGNTPAPKGHFILDVANPDRNQAAADEGFTLTLGLVSSSIAHNNGTFIGDVDPSTPVFDTDTTSGSGDPERGAKTGTFAYAGKNYSSSPKRITKATAYGTLDVGFAAGTSGNLTLTLYGKTGSAPANSTDGTSLGTTVFSDNNNESGGREITSSDTDTFFDYVWVRIARNDAASDTFYFSEIRFFQVAVEGAPVPATTERPTTIASYAGRVFYAGINGLGLNSSIYFTRVIRKNDEYEQCYQANDPTSPDFFDLLPDDGGVIKIPEIGTVTKLFPYQTSLIIIATNGVWRVAGGSGPFAANDYQVRKLSSIGSDAAISFVDYKGLPIWWGEDGILTLQYDPNYDSFAVVSLTDQTIKSFILDIPQTNRKYVKGTFNINDDVVYWIYNSDMSITNTEYYNYDRVLVMNGASKAFYPWTIEAGDEVVRGIQYVTEGARTQLGRIKYTVTNGTGMTYAETTSTDYHDWPQGDDVDYSSYFLTGYRLDASGIKFFQTNYVWVFMEEETDASCFMQGVWDWTTSSSTGKWSTLQQIYNGTLATRVMRMRRLKVRGKGKALQLRFESETGKPFTIVGWAYKGSANADI